MAAKHIHRCTAGVWRMVRRCSTRGKSLACQQMLLSPAISHTARPRLQRLALTQKGTLCAHINVKTAQATAAMRCEQRDKPRARQGNTMRVRAIARPMWSTRQTQEAACNAPHVPTLGTIITQSS